MRARVALVLAALAALAAAPRPAEANGRFPRSVKITFRPGSTTDLLFGLTFGMVVSRDDGATWRWTCESAIGFDGEFDPDFEYSPTGAIFANTFDGLRLTRDGCRWTSPPPPLGTTFVSAVAIGAVDGSIWAGTSDLGGSAIYKSADDGLTFQPTGPLGRDGDWWESIAVAPSDPSRVYVTGFRVDGGNPRQRLLFRSMNGGASWEELPTTAFVGSNISDLQLAALSPVDPDVMFVRMTLVGPTLQEAIYRTDDADAPLPAGPTWTKVLDLQDNIPGVVVRGNGEVWAATPFRGLHRSTDGGRTFTQVPGVQLEARCLAERPDGTMFLCTNNLPPDGASVHVSTTGAAGTWTPKLRFADITGPVRCDAGTSQHDDCEVILWCGLRENLGITSEEIDCTPPPPIDAGIDAAPDEPTPRDKGCCATGAGPGASAAAAGLALLGLLRPRRRRR